MPLCWFEGCVVPTTLHTNLAHHKAWLVRARVALRGCSREAYIPPCLNYRLTFLRTVWRDPFFAVTKATNPVFAHSQGDEAPTFSSCWTRRLSVDMELPQS